MKLIKSFDNSSIANTKIFLEEDTNKYWVYLGDEKDVWTRTLKEAVDWVKEHYINEAAE
jgi:hypothetical protein